MNEDLKISIIVPIYNVEKYLKECVQSLIDQTYKNIEIILVDDGSTDGSSDILDSLSMQDSRIKVCHKENGGTHSARNLGVANAEGKYIMFIDPDDWFSNDCVEIVVETIKSTEADLVKFNYVKEYGSYSENKVNSLLENKLYLGDDYKKVLRMNLGLVGKELNNIQDFNFLASVCFGCYKKEIINSNNLGFTNMREIGTFSDGLFNLSFLIKSTSFYFIDKHLYHYRRNNLESCTNKYRQGFVEKNKVLLGKIYNLINLEEFGQEFILAYNNRIAYSIFELIINAGVNNASRKQKKEEIKKVLRDEVYKQAIKKMSVKDLPIKWKTCFCIIKTRNVFLVYFLTKLLNRFKKRR